MKRLAYMFLAAASCGGEGAPVDPSDSPFAALSGGEATVFDDSVDAYSHPAPTLDREQERQFFRGRALFRDGWVTAPSSTDTRDGLGPVFNARSCVACHERDGRGRPPTEGEPMFSMLVRLSIPGRTTEGGPAPEPSYGNQMQPQGILQVPYEGRPTVTYEAEGNLQRPIYQLDDLQFGPLHPEVLVSARVAPSIFGLGLLEAVPIDTIEARADPDDDDGDGISGRPNYVWDVETRTRVLGRFGWKANQPSIEQQTAGAFNGDIGITSRLFPAEDCPPVQAACQQALRGGTPELIDAILDSVTFYVQTLAVPARRALESHREGERIFGDIGCERCHVSTLVTGEFPLIPEFEDQTIHPYTDLLLHDMGDGLADGRPDFEADGREWRTPPLWGIGLQQTVNHHTFYLHDGRARNLEEAILWHGGEAEAAARAYSDLELGERTALLEFLESL